ncbi:MAG: MFS transporter, partial [Caldisericaceae bacterium]
MKETNNNHFSNKAYGSKSSKYRWVVLAVYMYVAALTQLYWLNFAAVDTYVEQHLQISAMKVGLLALVFPLFFLLLSIPSGIIIDKKGYKFGVGIGAIFTGAFALLRLVNPNSFAVLLISQIGISIGQPFVLNGITKLSVSWFPKNEEATAVGLGSLSLFLGMILGLGATPALVQSFGFEKMLLIYGITGITSIPIFFLLTKPEPASEKTSFNEEAIPYIDGIKRISKSRDFIILGFISLIGIGVFNGLVTWLEKILNEVHHISMVDAGNISAGLVFSGMIGCIAIPMLSDKFMRRKPFLLLASVVGTISVIVLMFANGLLANSVNAIVMGFFVVSTLPIILTMSAEIAGAKFAGISSAYLQLLGNGAAVAIVPVMEALHSLTNQYTLPLAMLAALFGLLFIIVLFIGETFKKPAKL